MYAIAEYFPREARARAAGRRYRPTAQDPLAPYPRTGGGYCPLGWVLREMGVRKLRAPFSIEVALRIGGPTEVRALAECFIADWESGRIADLHTALGVPAPPAAPEETP